MHFFIFQIHLWWPGVLHQALCLFCLFVCFSGSEMKVPFYRIILCFDTWSRPQDRACLWKELNLWNKLDYLSLQQRDMKIPVYISPSGTSGRDVHFVTTTLMLIKLKFQSWMWCLQSSHCKLSQVRRKLTVYIDRGNPTHALKTRFLFTHHVSFWGIRKHLV